MRPHNMPSSWDPLWYYYCFAESSFLFSVECRKAAADHVISACLIPLTVICSSHNWMESFIDGCNWMESSGRCPTAVAREQEHDARRADSKRSFNSILLAPMSSVTLTVHGRTEWPSGHLEMWPGLFTLLSFIASFSVSISTLIGHTKEDVLPARRLEWTWSNNTLCAGR